MPAGGWPEPVGEIAPIAAIIGADAALRLVEARGGTRVYIADGERAQILAEIIGVDGARAMADHYGRGEIKVPVARRWRILCCRAAGLSYQAIALRAGTSEGVVWRTLSEAGETRQLDLFGRAS
jgi:hypothetical protein